MSKLFHALLAMLLVFTAGIGHSVELNPNHPEQYVVKKGDTLWDIASTFLKDPWFWPEVWHVNPQVANPHLIYPGDILRLVYRDGEPRVERVTPVGPGRTDLGSSGKPLEKLEPRARVVSVGGAIPTIPLDVIRPFLTGAQVVSEYELELAPYVVSSQEEHLLMAEGQKIYVRGANEGVRNYSLFRQGVEYEDPETGDTLGYEAIHIANARVVRVGDPSTIAIKDRQQVLEVLPGDRMIATNDDHLRSNFMPRPTPEDMVTRIIAVYGGVSQIGQYDVVILNKGEADGMQVGHVQRVWQNGEVVKDQVSAATFSGFFSSNMVKLPDEPAGTMMVFRTFDRVSMALILNATAPIHVYDTGRSPTVVPI